MSKIDRVAAVVQAVVSMDGRIFGMWLRCFDVVFV